MAVIPKLVLLGVIKRRVSLDTWSTESQAAWGLFFARDTLVRAIRKLHMSDKPLPNPIPIPVRLPADAPPTKSPI